MSSYKNLYLKTAYEYVENLKSGLVKLNQNPSDKEIIGEFYISAHSLKSQSTAMGYPNTATLCSIMEAVFREIKEEKRTISNELLSALANALEVLEKSIRTIESDNKESDLSAEIKHLAHKSGILTTA